MKILFLHLSDLHAEDSSSYTIRIEKLIESLKHFEHIDECIVIMSGDLVKTGDINQYKAVKNIFSSIFLL